ncbi:MAG: type I-E CRISPR-associated protein Cas5/CasD [Acidobacteria bacterium]|nr:type I-E CRISPR-associated protein Cas5/CasD [Acidobacteriota bacterium]
MKVLILRFDAPLVSFGGPSVDHNGVVQRFPARSMLTGLLANALGWCHRDTQQLQRLQDRLRFAARIDRLGESLVDYQTVALGLPWMRPECAGWTTHGRIAKRGGLFSDATHIRLRHYRADSVHTVALALAGDDAPTLEEAEAALREPARPLFIGRKCCLPAAPVLGSVVEAESLLDAIARLPRSARADKGRLPACWSDMDPGVHGITGGRTVAVTDERDWTSRVHVGRRLVREGFVDPPEASHG